MLTNWVRRLHLSKHQGRVVGLALSVLVILVLSGSILHTLILSHPSPAPSQGKSALLHTLIPNHPSPAPNQGKPVLLLSNPTKNGFVSVTLLTMVSSDGKVLWRYHLQGTLANGFSNTTDDQLKAGTAVRIVDGIVYFGEVLDANPDRPALSTYCLTALQAATGVLQWQHQMQATTLEVLGISNGVLVTQETVGTNSIADVLTASGYRATTGSLVWERRMAEHISYHDRTTQILDGNLYVGMALTSGNWTISAMKASTGESLWQHTTKALVFPLSPLMAGDGVVIQQVAGGDFSSHPTFTLSGLRESDGALLWSHEISQQGGFLGTLSSPFQQSGGLLYFATNVPTMNDLELYALQIARGTQLWHQQITADLSIGGRQLALANGTLYLPYTVLSQVAPLKASGLVLQAVQASNGALRWKNLYHPGQTEAPGWALIDGTTASTVVAESSDSQHTPFIGVAAGNGATLWHDPRVVYGELAANGELIVFSRRPPPDDRNQQLCSLQPDTGAVLWCLNVDGNSNWIIPGS